MVEQDRTKEEINLIRTRLKVEYGNLLESVSEILFRHDPARINYIFNTDEYDSEAETILSRLKTCKSDVDVLTIIREEFRRWLDAETAERIENKEIAEEIWLLWKDRKIP